MEIDPGWYELMRRARRKTLTRRKFLPGAAAFAGGLAFPELLAKAAMPDLALWPVTNPIKHVVILCQENRSFDHYFGAFADQLGSPGNRATGFNPNTLVYYDKAGQGYLPYHTQQFCSEDPDHTWEGSHSKLNLGAMDGWVAAENGSPRALQYFEAADHIYHVQLAQAFTLADHYYCSQIGPTLPNRLYLWSGTSGWDSLRPATTSNQLPFNNPSLTAPPPTLTWQTMGDALSAAGLPWKCYSVADGSVPSAIGAFNPLIFFQQMQQDPDKLTRATADFSEFILDLAMGTLPAVSWIITEAVMCEHPPAAPDFGQLLVSRVVQLLQASSAWNSTAMFLTYDEAGGFFDTVPPREILETVPVGLPDQGKPVGPAFRVPMMAISPYARPNRIYSDPADHTSILQFVEATFSTLTRPLRLDTIHPARRKLADLRDMFDFTQAPMTPALPTPQQLFAQANQTYMMLNAERTVASCATGAPAWVPQLLGV